ncbi:DNA repair protein complementing XP-C cells-like [Xenia sp. Carnegie-2017]|uniref:DNA repair protein complementing XP-C cells-like n=1 Tax=Xenia sp. Carnegie-2017 TaxID=2897299 RepID=UPI001F032F4E|nr:DNA repair protein complementing XP-C cells-like [Xenia sp. Carnegie-2017]
MEKSSKAGVSTKRKRSVNVTEENVRRIKGKRQKIARENNNFDVEKMQENSSFEKSDGHMRGRKKVPEKIGKIKQNKTFHKSSDIPKTTTKVAVGKTGNEDSSDEDLPLSIISKGKRKKVGNENHLELVGNEKMKHLSQSSKVRQVVGKVNIVKNSIMEKDSVKKNIMTLAKNNHANIGKTKSDEMKKLPMKNVKGKMKVSPSKKHFIKTPSPFKKLENKQNEMNVNMNSKESPLAVDAFKNLKNCPNKRLKLDIDNKSKILTEENGSESDGGDSDMEWEDVDEVSESFQANVGGSEMDKAGSTSSNVEVTINTPGGKKSRCGHPTNEEIMKFIQRKINKAKRKDKYVSLLKVHFLSLLAVGLKRNEMCNNQIVQAVGLSLVPDVFTQHKDVKKWDISFLTRVATWMKNKAPYPGEIHTGNSLATYLMRVLEKKVYLLVAILRVLGLSVRLIMSLQVLSLKVEEKNQKSKNKKRFYQKLKGKSPAFRKSVRDRVEVDYKEDTVSDYFSDANKTSKNSSVESFDVFDDDMDTDVDFEEKIPKISKGGSASKRGKSEHVNHISTPRQDAPSTSKDGGVSKKGCDLWIEVYLQKEKQWICIDGELCSVNKPDACERHSSKPIKYIIGFDNEGSIKDVTCRYATNWMTTTRKLRTDGDWLEDTMSSFRSKNIKRDKSEDSLLKARLLQKPLPQTVSEYKNHPLYVLKRHLLKFEAIYPESAATLGFCRQDAVYSRDCVHTLHTREMWIKEARVVKSGEQPYKIVKGRKSRRKMLENVGEVKAELFGRWQTEDYIPPAVVDGIVPRNEYGNVELFKPSMLPAGACHIQVPGIHRLARKLKIDAVPAVIGFDFHGGFNHPIIDGVVVGEEFKEQLLLAWDKEQEAKIAREQEKREKRILANWTHLVRSLRIRERLKRKYKIEEEDKETSNSEENKKTSMDTEDRIPDVSLSWPLNKQEGKTARDADGHCHVFLLKNNVQDSVTGEWSKVCACGLKEPVETL